MIKDSIALEIGISEANLEEIRDFAMKYPTIEKIVLYGSRAKGNFRPGSDLDMVLIGDELKLKDQLSFWGDLDDSYQPYLFDVAILSHINNESLLDHIQRVGKVIYKKK